jgi:hypothetical protein
MTWLAPALSLALLGQAAEPLRLDPDNPRYLHWNGKPAVLITSGEHYGAVLNRAFPFEPYLDELAARGFNLTRTFSGTYREVPGNFKIEANTLAPAPGQFLSPWLKVSAPGEPDRYDLTKFDPDYFQRLRVFLDAANRRGVVVEYVLFCPLYEDSMWSVSPLNAANNINKVGACPREEVLTLKHRDLVDAQLAFVRKAVAELNAAPNLYFEICNEPYFGGVTLEWQHAVADAIVAAEKDLPNKHLIAQNIANGSAKVQDPHPAVSIFNFHYAAPPKAVAANAHLNRPIVFDETGFKGNADRVYRRQAWEFLLAGGAGFSHLDYSYTVERPDGTHPIKPSTPGGGGPSFRTQLAALKRLIEGVPFTAMKPVPSIAAPDGTRLSALVEPGRHYLVYLHRDFDDKKPAPPAEPRRDTLSIDLPAGSYAEAWLDPITGTLAGMTGFRHDGGPKTFTTPPFAEDTALKLVGGPDPTP